MTTGNPTFGSQAPTEDKKKGGRENKEHLQEFEEAGLTQEEIVTYQKNLKTLREYYQKSFWETFKVALKLTPNIYTPEEEKLIISANAKLSNLEKKKNGLVWQEREILLEILTNQEERSLKFKEAELIPKEQEAYEGYLKDREELLKRLSTRWGVIKTRLNPFASESIPKYTPEKDKLIESAEKKLISIQRGRKEYSI
ncbi:MAG: hypothetical protein WCI76_02905 [bacterium]